MTILIIVLYSYAQVSSKLDNAIETISNKRTPAHSSAFDPAHSIYNTPTRSPAHSTPARPAVHTSPAHTSPAHMSPSHYAIPPSRRKPAKPKRVRYTEIDVSIYDNPKIRNTSFKGSGMEGAEQEAGQDISPEIVRRKKKEHKQKRPLHEDLLVFVSKEWKDLEIDVSGMKYWERNLIIKSSRN